MQLHTDKMQAEVRDGVGWIVFNNPARRNAVSQEMNEALAEIATGFEDDPDVRVVVMRGAGDRAFVSGADISEFEEKRSGGDAQRAYDEAAGRAAAALGRVTKPIVAMIRGYCIGGGLATALRADVRIAADDARFAIPAARLGLGYRYPGVQSLVQLVGPAYAAEILLSARHLTADEALRMGLVNRVVAVDDLEEAVLELVGAMAANAPLTMKAAKAAIREALRDPERRDLEHVDRLVTACFESEDYIEGRRAFMDKRTPRFQGR